MIPIYLTANGAVKGQRCVVYWVRVEYSNSNGNCHLRNGTGATGTSLCCLDAGVATNIHAETFFDFDPPILFPDGCYATLTNVSTITVGYN